jgi:SAM-dependent methyltransferase
MHVEAPSQYADDQKLAQRQRLWATSRREPPFDLYPWVLDLAGLGAGSANGTASTSDVLDVGCGNGAYERLLAEQGHGGRRVALDLSLGMLEGVEGAARVAADVQAVPFADDSFDVVLAPHMLYHVPDVVAAAHEARRVLRPAGRFVAVTNGLTNLIELCHLVEAAVGGGWKMRRPADEHFHLDMGGALLAQAFATVERVDCPPTRVVVTELDAVAGYVESVSDLYEEEVDVPWSTVVERVGELARVAAGPGGELPLTNAVGAFVCS